MREWKTSRAYPERAEPTPLNAANIRPNAKLTSLNECIHVRHILLGDFQHRYSYILLINSRYQWTPNSMCESSENTCPVWRSLFQGILLNNPIKLQKVESHNIFAANNICLALQTSEQFCLKARTRQPIRRRASSYPPTLINRPRSKWPLSNFRRNRIFAKTIRVFALSISEETWNHECCLFWYNIRVWRTDGRDGQTDRETDGHLCYCNTSACMACYATVLVKIHAWAWASWGRPPDSLPGLCFWIPLGDWGFRPPDSFASHHLTWNPVYAPELGASFSTPAFSIPAILMVPRFPLPRFQLTP